MNNKIIFKILIDVLFKVWLLCYGLTVLCFLIALISKMSNPEIKNLSWNDFTILGMVLLGFLIVNVLVIRRKARK